MVWLIVISILIFIPLSILGFLRPVMVPWLTFFILGLTLIVLIGYAYDTHQIAKQTTETNLKPVVLRSGYVVNWDSVAYTIEGNTINGIPLQITVLKNIAMGIHGYIVISHHKYTLLFGSPTISQIQSSQPTSSPTQAVQAVAFNPEWGWLSPNNTLGVLYNPNSSATSTENDGIYIEYKDIEGNSYFTREDQNFITTTGNL